MNAGDDAERRRRRAVLVAWPFNDQSQISKGRSEIADRQSKTADRRPLPGP
jgi:hypothetical protein